MSPVPICVLVPYISLHRRVDICIGIVGENILPYGRYLRYKAASKLLEVGQS
jgi:hypothetical protein